MARLSILISLLMAVAAFAQPFEGPFTIYERPWGIPLRDLRVVMYSDSTARLMAQDDPADTILCAPLRERDGWMWQVDEMATVLPGLAGTEIRGFQPLPGEGYAVLLHDSSEWEDYTRLLYRQGEWAGVLPIDSGVRPSGVYSNSSVNHALQLAPRAGGGLWIGWLDQWTYYNGQWGEAGCNLTLLPISATFERAEWPTDVMGAPFEGSLVLAQQNADTLLAVTGESMAESGSAWLLRQQGGVWSMPWGTWPDFLDCGPPAALLVRPEGDGLLLTHAGVSYQFGPFPAKLIWLEGMRACGELQTLESDPISPVTHSDYGVAWLSRMGAGLVVHRVDAYGQPVQPVGAVQWPEADWEIGRAALAVSESGKLLAVWEEIEDAPAANFRLRVVTFGWNTPLSAGEPQAAIPPADFSLRSYPNPFNATTTLEVALPEVGVVKLAVYDLLGREVAVLHEGVLAAGSRTLRWDAATVPAGVYFARLETPYRTLTQKLLLLK